MVVVPREIGFRNMFNLTGVKVKNFNLFDKIREMVSAAMDVAINGAADSAGDKTKPLKTRNDGINQPVNG